jgi:Skp family chaperone for outer membrane proteins
MKTIRLAAASFIFTAIFAVSAFAQPAAQAGANVKVMFINTAAFEAKDGITKYLSALSTLGREMEPLRAEIRTMVARFEALEKELAQMQTQINAATAATRPALEKQFVAKRDEYQALEINIKRKQEDGKARFERRQAELISPVQQDISRVMQDFAKQKGYSVILDVSKLAGAVLVYDEAKADVTKEFITFYNARTATAATAPPRPASF